MPSERESLVRRNFEAYRDLTWFESLEPKCREQEVGGEELQAFREAWNEHAEMSDWDWWQKEAASKPSGRLEDEGMDIVDRLDQLGCLRWLEEKNCREAAGNYREALAEASRRPANDNDRGMER
jgi:hypothetical protein